MQILANICWFLSNSVPAGLLWEKEKQLYSGTKALSLPGVTRWGSKVSSVQSLLDTQAAVHSLALEEEKDQEDVGGQRADAKVEVQQVLEGGEDTQTWYLGGSIVDHLLPFTVCL